MRGNTVAVGAPYLNDPAGCYDTRAGHIRVYLYCCETEMGWVQLGGGIDGEEDDNNGSGWSVSISNDGNIVAVGAP